VPTVEHSGVKFNVNEKGYLEDYHTWNEDIGRALAEREGLGNLAQEQMEILKFMRDYYDKFHAFPMLGYVCRNIHQPKECVSEQFMDPLEAWKIAGLPEPIEEVIEHLKRPAGPHHKVP
jgi:TusE/DsrC/DsvC family sulfur relay protein